jgi:thioredoxin reductase (NADPH)
MLDLAIIGGGPAGLTAGLYATRGGLKDVVMYEMGLPGGQITQSSEIENYPGFDKVMTGMELMEPWPRQCMKFGLKHEMVEVKRVSKDGEHFKIELSNGETTEAKSVIVCTGSTPKRAGIKGEDEFYGKGVSNCATCDGFFYKDKEVAVLGGGDTALEEALYLSNICSKVYLIHRRDSFRAAPHMVKKVKNTQNIELILDSVVDEILGDNSGVTGVRVKNLKSESLSELQVPGIFIFVGMNVNNEVLKQEDGSFLCQMSEWGEVVVDLKMQTNIEGLYAAGDIRIDAPKQVVCAAGDGAVAALTVISKSH